MFIFIKILTFISVVYSQSCEMFFSEKDIYAIQNEQIEWSLQKLMIGSSLDYYIDQENESYFTLTPLFEKNSDFYFSQQLNNKTPTKVLKTRYDKLWLNSFIFIDNSLDGSYLYLSQSNNLQDFKIIMKVFENGNCVNQDFLNEHIYIIACIKDQETKINLYLIDKDNNILDQYLVEEDFQINKIKLEIQQIDINQYVYLYQQTDIIYVFEILGNQIINCNCNLDKDKMELLLGYSITGLMIIDLQIAESFVFLLDQEYGIIKLKLLNNQWISAKSISTRYAFSQYVMMQINSLSDLNNNYGQYNIFITVSQNQYYIYQQFQTYSTVISYINIDFLDRENTFLYFNQYTIIVVSNNQIYFRSPYYVLQLDEVPIDVIGNPLEDKIQVYYKDRVEIRTIDRKITFQAQSKLISEPKTAHLYGYFKDDVVCITTFKYQIFHKNDGKLYEKLTTYEYNSLVFYPNYPQTQLSQIELPQGPNIQAKFKLEGQDTNKIIQSQYYNSVILTDQLGVINLSNYIFVQLVQSFISQQLLLLVQQSNWHTFLMKCKKTILSISTFECRTQAVSDFRYYLSSSNVKTYAFSSKIIMSLVNQNKHSLQLYEVSDHFQLITQINTKLIDENALITDFIVLSDKIIILLHLKQIIQIYSYEGVLLNEINLDSDPEWQPQHLYLNSEVQSRLLFVKCLNQVYIFYLNIDYQLLKKIKISNNLEVEMEIVIIFNQFFIFYKTINEQGMTAYSLFNILDIHYLIEIPLYTYVLQSPLQVVYHYIDNLIFIRVYDPISQNTNLLVMYPQNWLQARNYIETNINLQTYVLDKYPINLSIGNSQDAIIYAQINSVFYLLEVYTNIEATLQVSEEMQDGYIRDSQITSSYFNPFYPLDINLKSTSRFVNLYTNIFFNQIVFIKSDLTIGIEPQLYSIPIDTWFDGQIFQYEIECLQCGTLENSLVFMQNKIKEERTFYFDSSNIIDVEQLREYLVILTESNIILTSINAEIIIYIQPILQYMSPQYLEVSEEYNLIMVIGHTDIAFYKLSNFIIFYINRVFPNKVFSITALVMIDNFLILINQNSQIQFYEMIIEKENITLSSCSLVLYSAYFKFQYLDMISISAAKNADSTQLYMCETFYGVVWVTFQIASNNIVILDEGVFNFKVLLKQLDIQTSGAPLFYNLLKVDEYEDIFILLTDDSGGYIIRINQPQVTILQVIQNYSVFVKLKKSKYFQGYLCITYQDYQQNIVYTLNHIKKYLQTTQDLKVAKPILIEGGMATQINHYQVSPVLIFTYFNERINLFAIYQNGQSLTLFKIEDSVSIQIFNGKEYKSQQPITLKAFNSLTSTQIEFRLNQTDPNAAKKINLMIWIVVVFVVIVFVIIVIVLIFWVKQKYKKRKSIGKEVILIN